MWLHYAIALEFDRFLSPSCALPLPITHGTPSALLNVESIHMEVFISQLESTCSSSGIVVGLQAVLICKCNTFNEWMENHCIFRRDNLIPRLEPFIFRIYLLIVFFWIRICSISKEDTQDFLGSSPCSVWSKGSDQSESPIHLWHDWFFSVGRAGTAAWRISSISSLWRLVAIFLGNMRRRSGTTCWRISCPLSLFSNYMAALRMVISFDERRIEHD